MRYMFAGAVATNAFSITALLVAVGLFGRAELAAEIGIAQAAVLMIFLGLSGNSRNIALNATSTISLRFLLVSRLALLLPAAAVAFFLTAGLGMAAAPVTVCLILRRCVEWIHEIHLSERELQGDTRFARRSAVMQVGLFALAVALVLSESRFGYIGLLAWATLPMLLSIRFVFHTLREAPATADIPWREFVPHLGSTTVIAVSVYAFRSMVLVLVGKESAGTLFTAYSLGGAVPSIFAAALGPSLTFHAGGSSSRRVWRMLLPAIGLLTVAGAGMLVLAGLEAGHPLTFGKSSLFWAATGLSLVGGAVMLAAQQNRLSLLQNSTENTFGPDVLSNVMGIACVPFLFYAFGRQSLVTCYLLNSLFVLLFYLSTLEAQKLHQRYPRVESATLKLIAVLLCLPVFVQLSGGIFRSTDVYFDTGGKLAQLPLPLSVPACFAGILILGNYRKANRSLGMVFLAAVLMFMATLLSTVGREAISRPKMILAIQFILPMSALVLGELYAARERDPRTLPRVFLLMLAALVPLQLVASWSQAHLSLQPYVFGFSIYQFRQYVPVVFVCLYLFCLFSLFGNPARRWETRLLCVMTPIMGIYAVVSVSMLALGFFCLGCTLFCLAFWRHAARRKSLATCAAAALAMAPIFVMVHSDLDLFPKSLDPLSRKVLRNQFHFVRQTQTGTALTVPKNFVERWECWSYYTEHLLDNSSSLLAGHDSPPPRERFPSAHHYFIDLIFNFGLPAILPILVCIGYTLQKMLKNRRQILASQSLMGLGLAFVLMVVVDNCFKVGLRQPYPGILAFFLWGVFLGRLGSLPRRPRGRKRPHSMSARRRTPRRRPLPRDLMAAGSRSRSHEIRRVQVRKDSRLVRSEAGVLQPLDAAFVHRVQQLPECLVAARHRLGIDAHGNSNQSIRRLVGC
ncbi:MAG: hypothetical protein WD648_09780 [Planctomycetaceae bacterium]